jgi:hypothetical protein
VLCFRESKTKTTGLCWPDTDGDCWTEQMLLLGIPCPGPEHWRDVGDFGCRNRSLQRTMTLPSGPVSQARQKCCKRSLFSGPQALQTWMALRGWASAPLARLNEIIHSSNAKSYSQQNRNSSRHHHSDPTTGMPSTGVTRPFSPKTAQIICLIAVQKSSASSARP